MTGLRSRGLDSSGAVPTVTLEGGPRRLSSRELAGTASMSLNLDWAAGLEWLEEYPANYFPPPQPPGSTRICTIVYRDPSFPSMMCLCALSNECHSVEDQHPEKLTVHNVNTTRG